jgi:uncharacterized protein (TIGR00255 family)
MLKSMTGFGRAEQTLNERTFLVEVKSLNGKQFELQLRLPPLLRPFEFEIRNILQERLIRGTVDCTINIKQNGASKPVVINTDLIRAYYLQINELANELHIDSNSVLSALLRLPEVVTPSNEVISEQEFASFKLILESAINQLDHHRLEEGASLERDLIQRIDNINAQEEKIVAFEPRRMERMRQELVHLLETRVGKDNYDANRMEQELIYYIEKIDIHEEQVRLKQHCEYFRSLLLDNDPSKGKKLSFLIQEMGREINTTGSKAYDADIQKCVVTMKDELEKAKEQILNVL